MLFFNPLFLGVMIGCRRCQSIFDFTVRESIQLLLIFLLLEEPDHVHVAAPLRSLARRDEPPAAPSAPPPPFSTWPRQQSLTERWRASDLPFSPIPADSLPCHGHSPCPWYVHGATGDIWEPAARCNPYSRLCTCLREWLGDESCPAWTRQSIDRSSAATQSIDASSRPIVRLAVEGWLTEWPYEAGVRSCARSFCDVMHGRNLSNTHAQVYSVLNGDKEAYPGFGRMTVGVSMESPANFASLDIASFRNYFHVGVSHRRGHMDLHTTYNNYFPAQFRSRGAPFGKKRDSLLFAYTACHWQGRNKLFDELLPLIQIDAVGRCKHNTNIIDILPQCASLPRSGRTVWQESECLLHHYKFYLAIENTREPDYITEKLWQGLRAGAVPIYLGAHNVRDFLPDRAAVYIDDFPTLAELVVYIKSAVADESIYQRHHAWKDAPFPGRFINSAFERAQDALLCRVCDHIASDYGSTTGPILGARGRTVFVPPCISTTLFALQHSILRDWAIASRGWQTPGLARIDRIYTISIKSAPKRRMALAIELLPTGLGSDLVTAFDGHLLTDEDRYCWAPRLRGKADGMFSGRELSIGELSVAMKHVAAAWDVFHAGHEIALVLEDDVYLLPSFSASVAQVIGEAPPGWDFIFVGGCYNLQAVYWAGVKVTDKLWRVPRSRCAHAYLMSFEGAAKLLRSLPITTAFDIHVSDAIENVAIYWVEACEAYQREGPSLIGTHRSSEFSS